MFFKHLADQQKMTKYYFDNIIDKKSKFALHNLQLVNTNLVDVMPYALLPKYGNIKVLPCYAYIYAALARVHINLKYIVSRLLMSMQPTVADRVMKSKLSHIPNNQYYVP